MTSLLTRYGKLLKNPYTTPLLSMMAVIFTAAGMFASCSLSLGMRECADAVLSARSLPFLAIFIVLLIGNISAAKAARLRNARKATRDAAKQKLLSDI